MKIESVYEELFEGVQTTERIAGRHQTLPVLNCLLLTAEKNTLKIRSTNLDIGIEFETAVKIIQEGVVAVPASVLLNTLANSTEKGSVQCELKDGVFIISTPNSKTSIKTLSPEDFPTLPFLTTKALKLHSQELLKGLKAVWYSASTSTIKPEIGSVYIYPEGSSLVFVATDSFRLAEKIIPTRQAYNFEAILIQLRSIPEIIRLLERNEGEAAVRMNENQISVSFPKVFFTSRLVQGTFPDYRQIIPKEFVSESIILKQDLISILRKAAIFSGKFNQVSFHIHPKKKLFSVSAQSEVGETNDIIAGAVSGEEIDIHFNLKYLTDCFSAIAGDSISLSASGPAKPMVVKDVADNSFLYLVMPMNRE